MGKVVDVEDAADPRGELRAHAPRARIGLIPVDDPAAEEAEDVLITEIAVASEIFGRSTLSGLIEALA
jgi:hypothetical protein